MLYLTYGLMASGLGQVLLQVPSPIHSPLPDKRGLASGILTGVGFAAVSQLLQS